MKKITRLFLMLFILPAFQFAVAQPNLVLNPGLDNYITCPGFGQFSNTYINDWTKPSWGSTDYYHTNCPGIYPADQIPHSGNAYAGIICYNYGTEYREYMTGTLASPLVAGMSYYVEFYVSLNDGYIQAIKEVGAHFSNAVPGPYANALHIPLIPQIEHGGSIISDTSLWVKVSGNFIAAGGEQYITIGNFHDDSTTTIVQVGNIGSYGTYYFIDDVLVSAGEQTYVTDADDNSDRVSIYPNPTNGKFSIFSNDKIVYEEVWIYNSLGEKIYSEKENPINREITISDFSDGVYLLKVFTENGVVSKKFLLNR